MFLIVNCVRARIIFSMLHTWRQSVRERTLFNIKYTLNYNNDEKKKTSNMYAQLLNHLYIV